MAYKSYPWYCMVCDRWFQGGMGRASHYRGKGHKENSAKLTERHAEATKIPSRGFTETIFINPERD